MIEGERARARPPSANATEPLEAERACAVFAARELLGDLAVYRRQLQALAHARLLVAREAAADRLHIVPSGYAEDGERQ